MIFDVDASTSVAVLVSMTEMLLGFISPLQIEVGAKRSRAESEMRLESRDKSSSIVRAHYLDPQDRLTPYS